MFVTNKVRDIRTIRQGDPAFMINDGMVAYPRAMFHITPECPRQWRDYIELAISEGYLKHVYGKELTMDAMR
jgi:hypothetical protein